MVTIIYWLVGMGAIGCVAFIFFGLLGELSKVFKDYE